MVTFTIRRIPENLHAKLEQRAAAEGRTTAEVVVTILENSLAGAQLKARARAARARERRLGRRRM